MDRYPMHPNTMAALAPYMTLTNALAHARTVDKWVYIIDHVVDPAGLPRTQMLTDFVEDTFHEMIKINCVKVHGARDSTHGFSEDDIAHEARFRGCTDAQALASLMENERNRVADDDTGEPYYWEYKQNP